MRPLNPAVPLVIGAGALLWLAAMAAGAQESPNYRMERISVIAGGSAAASPNYTMRAVIGQESPDGSASTCSSGRVGGFGFWSVLGPGPAPIILTVTANPTDPQNVQLSWSGVEPLFHVHRDSLPDDLLDPRNLHGETAACGMAIDESASGDIVYYRVVAQPPAD